MNDRFARRIVLTDLQDHFIRSIATLAKMTI